MIQQIKYKQQILEFSNLNLITGTMASDSYTLFQKLIDELTEESFSYVAYNKNWCSRSFLFDKPNFKMWFLKICGIEFTEMKTPIKDRVSEIVSVLLNAKPSEIIFLEYPEIYLHPSSQSKLAELICEVSNRGTQVFCLTHSDHIFDSIRVLIKEGKLDPASLKTYFLDMKNCYNIELSNRGRITSKIPNGFFDQNTIHLDKLL